jgi:hypothetical protein
MEQQLTSLNNVVQLIANRMSTQESRLEEHVSRYDDSQLARQQTETQLASTLQQLVVEVQKLQSAKVTSPPSHPEPPVTIPISTPYQPPHART